MKQSEILAYIPVFWHNSPFCELPDDLFQRGGHVDDAVRALGYDESATVVIGQQRAWGLTACEWAENMEDVSEAEAWADEPTYPLDTLVPLIEQRWRAEKVIGPNGEFFQVIAHDDSCLADVITDLPDGGEAIASLMADAPMMLVTLRALMEARTVDAEIVARTILTKHFGV